MIFITIHLDSQSDCDRTLTVNESIDQSINLLINQSIDRSINLIAIINHWSNSSFVIEVLEPFHERGATKYIRLDTYMGTHGLTGVLSQLLRRFWRNGDGDVTGTALAYWRLDR